MQFSILSTALLVASAQAANIVLYASTGCNGASVGCFGISGNFCCFDNGQVYASSRLEGSGSLFAYSGACSGVQSGTVGANTCLSPSFAIQSAVSQGASRLAAGAKIQSVRINGVQYTNSSGVERIVQIPEGREDEISAAVHDGELAVLDTLSGF